MTRQRSTAYLAFAILALAACDGGGPLEPRFDADAGQFLLLSPHRPELLQIVRLTPLSPARGDTLRIDAMLVNRGTSTVAVWTRLCGLSTRGTLTLRDPFFRCAAYSGLHTLAPGDTVKALERLVVDSPAGNYILELMHLVEPELWVRVPVTVR